MIWDVERKEEATIKNRTLNNDPPGLLDAQEFQRRMAMTRKKEQLQADKGVKKTETGILIPEK